MGTVEVIRSRNILGTMRNLNVEVDGTRVGVVKYNSETTFSLAPGPHQVAVKMDWYKSNPVHLDVETGQTYRLRASQSKGVLPFLLMLGALGAFLLRGKFGYTLEIEEGSTA